MEAFSNEVCACQDQACAEAVQTKYLQWFKDNQDAQGTKEHLARSQAAAQKFADCFNEVSPVAQ